MTRPTLDPLAAPSQPRDGLWAAPSTPATPRAPEPIQAAPEPGGFGGVPMTAPEKAKAWTALKAIEACMQDGCWWSSNRLMTAIKARHGITISESAATARVRDLRKPQFGGYEIQADRTKAVDGRWQHWVYRMVLGGGQ